MEQSFDNLSDTEIEQLNTTELLLSIIDDRYAIAEQIDASSLGDTSLKYDELHVDKTYLSTTDLSYRIPPDDKAIVHAKLSKSGKSPTLLDSLLIEPSEKLSSRLVRYDDSDHYRLECGGSYITGDKTLATDCLAILVPIPEGESLPDNAVDLFAEYFANLSSNAEEDRSFHLIEDNTIHIVRFNGYYSSTRDRSTDRIEITQLVRENDTEPFFGIQLILTESLSNRIKDTDGDKITESHLYLEKVRASTALEAIEKVTSIERVLYLEGELKDTINDMSQDHKAAILETLDALKQSSLN